mmetsp:Transcript_59974/g.70075  ORF Transcript_59974/g.70075 Transcript_59974/m.70075 type:complete len:417 (+) Transcript_59974:192-1442(+)
MSDNVNVRNDNESVCGCGSITHDCFLPDRCSPSKFAPTRFLRSSHIKFFTNCLSNLPAGYTSLDTNRLTLVHFCVQSLDLLGALDDDALGKNGDENTSNLINKSNIIDWIYSLYDEDLGGFCGGAYLGNTQNYQERHAVGSQGNNHVHQYRHVHIAMTFTALATLAALKDDFKRLTNPHNIIVTLRKMQRSNGSYGAVYPPNASDSESDLRFVYCACAISTFLSNWDGIDVNLATKYIHSCGTSFDGGIGLVPGQESHGGSTFCGVASLKLMGMMGEDGNEEWKSDLIRWCSQRQVLLTNEDYNPSGGMQGRPNKLQDTCYSYWIGGSLLLLDSFDVLDHDALQSYVMSCQNEQMGGFSKVHGAMPDVLHSFYSLCYLSISQEEGSNLHAMKVNKMECALNVRSDKIKYFDVLRDS